MNDEIKNGIYNENGMTFLYKNGLLHCEDGPAVSWKNGSEYWYLNGLRHRKDGPAIHLISGNKEWWLNGKKLNEIDFNNLIFWNNFSNKIQ